MQGGKFQLCLDVDLSEFEGESIRIVLQWTSFAVPGDMAIMDIDNFKVFIPYDHDLAAIDLNGPLAPVERETHIYTVDIINFGLLTATNYTVNLMQVGCDIPLAFAAGVPVEPFTEHTIEITWTPTEVGTFEIFGQIEWELDYDLTDNETESMIIEVLPDGLTEVALGDWSGDAMQSEMFVFFYDFNNAMTQAIYYEEEINVTGIIRSLIYRFDGAGNIPETVSNVRILMGVFDIDEFGLLDAPTDLINEKTVVFEGSIPVQGEGLRDINITLDNPFIYTGGNLLITTWRLWDDERYLRNYWDFTATPVGTPWRTVVQADNTINYDDPDQEGGGWVAGNRHIPNVRLRMQISELGRLEGVVSSSEGAISGARVRIDGTNRYYITNEDGKYSFDPVPEGEITLIVSAHGYITEEIDDVMIVEDETTIEDITMTPRPRVTVSGNIIASDTNEPLAKVTVKLEGYDNYETLTDEEGDFTFENVFIDLTYTLIASKFGYRTHIDTAIAVGSSELTIPTVTLEELAFPVLNVVAVANEADTQVMLTWDDPVPGENLWFSHTRSNVTNSIGGDEAGFKVEIHHRYTSSQIHELGLAGASMTHLEFMMWRAGAVSEVNIKIYQGGSDSPLNPGNLIHTQSVPASLIVAREWLNITLSSPVAIPAVGEFWIGLELTLQDTSRSIGVDAGPAQNGFGNIIYWPKDDINWTTLANLGGGRPNGNFMIRGFAESTTGVRALESFNIYRANLENLHNQEAWTRIATIHTPPPFIDATWGTAETDAYRYIIRSVYTDNNISNPAYSNIIGKNKTATVHFTIEPSDDSLVEGAVVTLINNIDTLDTAPVLRYSAITSGNTVSIPNVWQSNYSLIVEHLRFIRFSEDDVDIFKNPTEIVVELQERASPPRAVVAVNNETNIALTWSEPIIGDEQWFSHSPGQIQGGMGTGQAGLVKTAHRYTPNQLAGFNVAGTILTKVGFVPWVPYANSWELQVYIGGSGSPLQPGDLIYTQAINLDNLTMQDWNYVSITQEITIPTDKEMWVTFAIDVQHSGPPAVDFGPMVLGYGNVVFFNDNWSLLSNHGAPGVNWLIKCFAEGVGPKSIVFSPESDKSTSALTLVNVDGTRNLNPSGDLFTIFTSTERGVRNSTTQGSRILEGYTIWRFHRDDLEVEDDWDIIAENVTELEFVDRTWRDLGPGVYLYAIRAVYTNDNLSDPVFSNIVHKGVTATVVIEIVTEDGANLEEADVRLVNHQTDPPDVYQGIAIDNTIAFRDVWFGQYTLTVSHPNYLPYINDNVVIDSDVVIHTAILGFKNRIMFEGFEDEDFPPPGWLAIDHDDDGRNWVNINTITTGTFPPKTGIGAAASESWCDEILQEFTPDNYLISPPIIIPANAVLVNLNYWVRTAIPNFPYETYSVMVSTTTNIDDFEEIFNETLQPANTTWTERTISLNQFIGQTIHIAWRHHLSIFDSMYFMAIDDVEVYYSSFVDDTDIEILPIVTRLIGNFPNPFNPETIIRYQVANNKSQISDIRNQLVNITIYNIRGQRVRTLVNDYHQPGEHSVIWNGRDDHGNQVSSGVYFYRMTAGEVVQTRRMLLMK
jgi:hypothetical protein